MKVLCRTIARIAAEPRAAKACPQYLFRSGVTRERDVRSAFLLPAFGPDAFASGEKKPRRVKMLVPFAAALLEVHSCQRSSCSCAGSRGRPQPRSVRRSMSLWWDARRAAEPMCFGSATCPHWSCDPAREQPTAQARFDRMSGIAERTLLRLCQQSVVEPRRPKTQIFKPFSTASTRSGHNSTKQTLLLF
jgi:hypothetical protein